MVLKEIIKVEERYQKLLKSFGNLRADTEVTLDSSKQKLKSLKDIYVDIDGRLDNLTSTSTVSSGVVSGLRGTGKTHLFLLAKNEINKNIIEGKAICVYINLKRFDFPSSADKEILNRAFSLFLYSEVSAQLLNIINQNKEKGLINSLKLLFDNDKKEMFKNLEAVLDKIVEFKRIVSIGNQEFTYLTKADVGFEDFQKEALDLRSKIKSDLNITKSSLGAEFEAKISESLEESIKRKADYLRYLNLSEIRKQLVEIVSILKIDSFTFYLDEWEKLYNYPNAQEYMAEYINKIIETPLHFWLGIVPHRGGTYSLVRSADLVHTINLDEGLIYENSKEDRQKCVDYFKNFINKRLKYYLAEECSYKDLLGDDRKLGKLVIASMGNSRDFGVMFHQSLTEFKSSGNNRLKYISLPMIRKSIIKLGNDKVNNISNDENVLRVWNDLESYCKNKKSSHFVILDDNENKKIMNDTLFSELIYQRMLHFRKEGLSGKDKKIEGRLALYALNYSSTYELHEKDKKMEFMVEYNEIHDKVRRYIYDPSVVYKNIKIKEGEIVTCPECSEEINIIKMKPIWEMNICPFCRGKLREE